MCLISSALLYGWEFVRRHPGITLVFVGVVGEIILDWTGTAEKFKKSKKAFWICLVVGLAFEFGEASKEDRQVEELRRANNELEARLKPRRITAEQMVRFKFLTERITKVPIKIISVQAKEPLTFAHDLREMFTFAGFKTNDDVDAEGINVLRGALLNKLGYDPGNTNLMIVRGTTNEPDEIIYIGMDFTNGVKRPIVLVTNEPVVHTAIRFCLDQDGIPSSLEGITGMAPPGGRIILVGEKGD